MGRQKNKSTLELADGVYLKQTESGIWHYNFTFSGKAFRASTKTKDKAKASVFALNAYHDAVDRKRSGKVVEKISFKKLSQKYLESIKGQSETKVKFHREHIKRHLLEFFGKVDDISTINNGFLNDYMVYRRKKTDGVVTNQTLNRENTVLNQMLSLGADYKWVEKGIKLKHQSETESRNRRSHFNLEQYDRLIRTSRKRAAEYGSKKLTAKERGMLTNKHWQRNLLHDIILVIANSGIRVDELKTVTWGDIDWDGSAIILRTAGKTKSSRRLLLREYGMVALKRIKTRREAHLKESGKTLKLEEHIQAMPTGRFVKSFKKGFRELLKAAGFVYEKPADWHSMTSLRHTYATFRLTTKKGNKSSMRGLSQQMGTSQKMIERHYGHDTVDDYRDELLG